MKKVFKFDKINGPFLEEINFKKEVDSMWFDETLKDKNIRFTDWAEHIINCTDVETLNREVNIPAVIVSLKKLGFTKQPSYFEICSIAKEFGLYSGPVDFAFYFCLEYEKKMKNKYKCLYIATKAIKADDGDEHIFFIKEENDHSFLDVVMCDEWLPSTFPIDSYFVFIPFLNETKNFIIC